MSIHTVEHLLWEVCTNPEVASKLRGDPDAVFSGRALTDAERRMIEDLDVRTLADHKVNQMLIMMTWNVLIGAEKIPEYLAKLNQTDGTTATALSRRAEEK